MADYSTQIAALEAILDAGTSRVSVDGLAAEYDMGEIRKRLAELRLLDDAARADQRVRPASAKIKLPYFSD